MILVFLCFGLALAQPDGDAVDRRACEAYLAVRAASESRGDVGELVDMLNQALAEYEAGVDPGVVLEHLDTVITLASKETARSVEEHNSLLAVKATQLALVGVLIYASWRLLPKLFWRSWLKVRDDWVVEYADR